MAITIKGDQFSISLATFEIQIYLEEIMYGKAATSIS